MPTLNNLVSGQSPQLVKRHQPVEPSACKKPQVLLTRPAGENETLAAMLQAQGYGVQIRPLLQLSAIPDRPGLHQIAMRLDQYHRIVFVSKSSVRFGLAIAEPYWPQWPGTPEWLAVGPGTALELDQRGIRANYPESPGSEGLLQLLGHPVAERILIVRGRGGRELLFDELTRRGGRVEYWEVYVRSEVTHDDIAALVQQADRLVVVLTSREILDNFARQAGSLVGRCLALVPSQRIADQARSYAFDAVCNAGGASEQALYDAVISLSSARGRL